MRCVLGLNHNTHLSIASIAASSPGATLASSPWMDLKQPGSSDSTRRDTVRGVAREDESDTRSTRSSGSMASQRSRQVRKRRQWESEASCRPAGERSQSVEEGSEEAAKVSSSSLVVL